MYNHVAKFKSLFGIAMLAIAAPATTMITPGETNFAVIAASPNIKPPTMDTVLPIASGILVLASINEKNTKTIMITSTEIENGVSAFDAAIAYANA